MKKITNDNKYEKNKILNCKEFIISVANSKGIKITEDNFKIRNGEECLYLSHNGKEWIVIVNYDGSLTRLDKNTTGRLKRNKMSFHKDKCSNSKIYSWIIMLDSVATTHNPKSMNQNLGKSMNLVDRIMNKK
ncbi:hypothetical protein [Clostridium tagluense]|uniref:Uncharacterized protein n=1 Tax=Clostridium tagluense TaxID=360422 RepID=A0A401ULN7_9CLOT|nr:hypothetical protein [Clostridium tagluense]GCD10442.1 hypothetical protein Ctaglu_20650 [Clostridium tagluense]